MPALSPWVLLPFAARKPRSFAERKATLSRRTAFPGRHRRPGKADTRVVAAFLAAAVLLFHSAAANAQPVDQTTPVTPADIQKVLLAMETGGSHFDPRQLQMLGRPGLSGVLDHLLPDTAAAAPPRPDSGRTAALIAQLGHERFRVREAATLQLSEMGSQIKPALIEATDHADAEIAWRAKRILRKWEAKQEDAPQENPQVAALTAYLQHIEDDGCLMELAVRTRKALERGIPGGWRYELLWQSLMAIARSRREDCANALRPLLAHRDVGVPLLVVDRLGYKAGNPFFPAVMREALQSSRSEIAFAAIRALPERLDYPGKDDVRRRLIAVFAGKDEVLKLYAAFPLMRDFDDPAALDCLLAEASNPDTERRTKALGWLGHRSVLGRPVPAKLLESFTPLLKSKDFDTRRTAAETLAMYAGEEVVRSLLPLLDDPNSQFAEQMAYRLDHQPDKQMLRRVLSAAAKDDANETVRQRAATVLENLDRRQ